MCGTPIKGSVNSFALKAMLAHFIGSIGHHQTARLGRVLIPCIHDALGGGAYRERPGNSTPRGGAALSGPGSPDKHLIAPQQRASPSMILKWAWERRKLGLPSTGWLEASGRQEPTPAEFQAAFPSHAVDYHALQKPPGALPYHSRVTHQRDKAVEPEGAGFAKDSKNSRHASFAWPLTNIFTWD